MNVIKLTLLILGLTTQLFSCGGCVDSFLASTSKEAINSSYDAMDESLSSTIGKLKEMIENTIKDEEYNNLKMIENTILDANKLLELEQLKFNITMEGMIK